MCQKMKICWQPWIGEIPGFEAKAAPNLRRRKQYLAGSDQQRADDLNGMFADDEVDAIFVCAGVMARDDF